MRLCCCRFKISNSFVKLTLGRSKFDEFNGSMAFYLSRLTSNDNEEKEERKKSIYLQTCIDEW